MTRNIEVQTRPEPPSAVSIAAVEAEKRRALEFSWPPEKCALAAAKLYHGQTISDKAYKALEQLDNALYTAVTAYLADDIETFSRLCFVPRVNDVLRRDLAELEVELEAKQERDRAFMEAAEPPPAEKIPAKRTDATLASIYEKETVFYPMRNNWRATTDPETGETIPRSKLAFSKRVKRHMNRAISTAAEQETDLYYVTLSANEHKAILKKLRNANNYLQSKGKDKPFLGQSYPLHSGDVVLVLNEAAKNKIQTKSDSGNKDETHCHFLSELPIDDEKRLKKLFKEWVDTPHGHNAPAFNGYGAKYKGTRGDTRPKDELKERRGELVCQVVVRGTKKQIQNAYIAKGYTVDIGYFGHSHVTISAVESYNVLTESFSVYSREPHVNAWAEIMAYAMEQSGAAVNAREDTICL